MLRLAGRVSPDEACPASLSMEKSERRNTGKASASCCLLGRPASPVALRDDALAREVWVSMAFARPRRFFSWKLPVPRPD
eukprot:12912001-Prorocentrum_lima.AAC.1